MVLRFEISNENFAVKKKIHNRRLGKMRVSFHVALHWKMHFDTHKQREGDSMETYKLEARQKNGTHGDAEPPRQ